MADHTFFDVFLDYGGDELAARSALIKRGFTRAIAFDDFSIDLQKEFLNKNDLSYGFLTNSECEYLFTKTCDDKIVDKWLSKVSGAKLAKNLLNDTQTLIKPYYGRVKLRKNAQQKIKISNLRTSANIDCSKLNKIQHNSYTYNSKNSSNKLIYNLITAILTSYKSNGMDIDSSKDFKKLIDMSDNREYLKIKFFDEAQAAEFLFVYGDELK